MDKPDTEQNTSPLNIDEMTELIRSPDVLVRERAVEKLALFGLKFLGKGALIGQLVDSSEARDNNSETDSFDMEIQDYGEAIVKLAEQRRQLEIEKQTLQNYLEGGDAGTWQLDVVSGKQTFDELSATMVGYSIEELHDPDSGVTWESIVRPDDSEKSKVKLQKCINGETNGYVCELRIKCEDGREMWVENKGKVFERDENGNALRMLGTTIDITERKHAEEELRDNESQFRALFENASDGIVYVSSKAEVIKVNKSFAEMHGYTVEEMQNMNLHDLDVEDLSDLLPERMRRAMSGENIQFEVKHFHKDGHIIDLEVAQSLVSLKRENYVVGFHRDITERKQLEEEVLVLTLHDELTGLGNRRYLKQELDKLKQSGRKNPISIISMDIFDFKVINDTYGHDAGDKVLRTISDVLKDSLRPDDIIVRMGGDEFVAVLPLTSEEATQSIKTRIEEKLTSSILKDSVKLSMGVVTAIDKADDLDDLLTLADKMMYKHKKFQRRTKELEENQY